MAFRTPGVGVKRARTARLHISRMPPTNMKF
jgi:hypothetical protein